MAVLKVLEIMSDSSTSWEDAAEKGIKKAAKSVDNIKSAYVQEKSVTVSDGAVDTYRINLKVTFEVS